MSATMDYIVQYGLHLNVNNNKGYDKRIIR
jgi:hypothetical protein